MESLMQFMDSAKRGRPKGPADTIKNPEKAKNISEEIFNRFLNNPRFTYKGKTEEYKKAFRTNFSKGEEKLKKIEKEMLEKINTLEDTDGYVLIDGVRCKRIKNEFRAILKQGMCGESYFKWWIKNYRLINELTD